MKNNKSNKVLVLPLLLAFTPLIASAAEPGPIVQWTEGAGGNGHYYQVIKDPGIEWTAARDAASGLSYEGGTGYLTTITSAGEDAFIDALRDVTTRELWSGGFQSPVPAAPAANWTWVTDEPFSYTNWAEGEPNDAGGDEQYLGIGWAGAPGNGQWNDESALGNIDGYVVEYEAGVARVIPGDNVPIFNEAGNEGSPNPLTAAYQKVLEAGAVSIRCCTVEDTREGPNGYQPNQFDLGLALADTSRNESCEGMPYIPQGTAKLHKWHRGVPNPTPDAEHGAHDLAVCVLESDAESEGIMFTADQVRNVLNYEVDCAATNISDRPFTGSVHLNPPEVDAPFVVRRSSDCDLSRTGLRSSTNLMVLNLRHDTAQMATNPYLSKDAAALKDSIAAIKVEGCVDPGFLDQLDVKVQNAKQIMQKVATNKRGSTAEQAVNALNDATRQALLIAPYEVEDNAASPYGVCSENSNPKGLLVSRLMALKFAACSELQYPSTHSSSSVSGSAHCVIAEDIWDALPTLPDQERCKVGGAAGSECPSP